MNFLIRKLVLGAAKVLGPVLFESRYLKGRHFDGSNDGWKWVMRAIWFQKILGFNRGVPWPVSPFIHLSDPKNIEFDPDDLNNFQGFGIYFQNFSAGIHIGKGSYIAPNVGLITANHDPQDPSHHIEGMDIHIGRSCWIGMNSVILPGVILGDRTVVGAGSVVNKCYIEGNCLIAGVPAKLIKKY